VADGETAAGSPAAGGEFQRSGNRAGAA